MFPPKKEEIKTKFVSIEVVEGTYKEIYINVFKDNGKVTDPYTIPMDLNGFTVVYGVVFAEDGKSLDTGEQIIQDGEIEDGAVKIAITPEMTKGKAVGALEVRLFEDADKPVTILIGEIRVVESKTPNIFE